MLAFVLQLDNSSARLATTPAIFLDQLQSLLQLFILRTICVMSSFLAHSTHQSGAIKTMSKIKVDEFRANEPSTLLIGAVYAVFGLPLNLLLQILVDHHRTQEKPNIIGVR